MQVTLPLVALATGAVLPSSLHAVYDALVCRQARRPGCARHGVQDHGAAGTPPGGRPARRRPCRALRHGRRWTSH